MMDKEISKVTKLKKMKTKQNINKQTNSENHMTMVFYRRVIFNEQRKNIKMSCIFWRLCNFRISNIRRDWPIFEFQNARTNVGHTKCAVLFTTSEILNAVMKHVRTLKHVYID